MVRLIDTNENENVSIFDDPMGFFRKDPDLCVVKLFRRGFSDHRTALVSQSERTTHV